MAAPPCRLFVIPARDVPVAAILRRGPTDWYQVIEWDTRRDVFTDGAWLKGRIYGEKCDLSPDGKLLVYFCRKGGWREGYTDSWTAVSRLPWLHALGLWPSGTTYGGGGRFVGNRSLVLRGCADRPHPDHPGKGLEIVDGEAELHRSTERIEGADWSGSDQAGQVIFCRGGKLFRRQRAVDVELQDFTGGEPDPGPPPQWATRPLR